MKTKYLAIWSMAMAVSLVACEEDDLDDLFDDSSTELAAAYIGAESEFLDAYNRLDMAIRDSALVATGSSTIDGAAVTYDQALGSITMDFGNTNVLTSDGKARRGKLMINGFSPAFLVTPNAAVSISTDEYHVDDDEIDISFDLTNRGMSGTSQYYEVDTFQVDLDNGDYLLRGRKDLFWVQGYNTFLDMDDDIYRIEGRSFASEPDDTVSIDATFSSASPMTVDRSCDYVVTQGVIDLIISDDDESPQTGSVDFIPEDGCNNLMRLTVNGITTTVTMPDF